MILETITEKIFKFRVKVHTADLKYVEMGKDFIRIRAEDGELYDIKVVKTTIRKARKNDKARSN